MPSFQNQQSAGGPNSLKVMAGLAHLQTPLREIAEEASGDLTNTSYINGGKKKKKKKKKRSGDVSYANEDDLLDYGNEVMQPKNEERKRIYG